MMNVAAQAYTEPALVAQARNHDPVAFSVLFRAYYDSLCTVARHYVGAPEVAEELVQEIFMNIWRMGGGWQPRGPVQAYLCGAARYRSLQYLRSQRLRQQRLVYQAVHEGTLLESPEGELQYKELEKALQSALDALPERRCLIYLLSRQHGLTYAEIAAALEISIKTVETQIGRALKFLRRRLATFR